MPDETKAAGAKPKYRPRRLLNPRRVQGMLKRVSELMLADSRNPTLTTQERIACLKAAADYTKTLATAEGRKRKEHRPRKRCVRRRQNPKRYLTTKTSHAVQ
jgi:hypothetical protein